MHSTRAYVEEQGDHGSEEGIDLALGQVLAGDVAPDVGSNLGGRASGNNTGALPVTSSPEHCSVCWGGGSTRQAHDHVVPRGHTLDSRQL